MPMNGCRICASPTALFAKATLLGKYEVCYYRCTDCGFIGTEDPFWLREAYSEAISAGDVGILQRNLQNGYISSAVITLLLPNARRFLDYGGGCGTFVRLMRDRGFDFKWHDLYASNIHARGFEREAGARYDLVTSFETFEHLPDPSVEIPKMIALSDNVLATTLLLPEPAPKPGEWWYYAPSTGQHISFYTRSALARIARRHDRHFCSNGVYHLFSRSPVNQAAFRLLTSSTLARMLGPFARRPSLTEQDASRMLG